MDNDNENHKYQYTDKEKHSQAPTMRPLQPVGAKLMQKSSVEPSSDLSPDNGTSYGRPPKNPAIIGALCGLLGLVIGGVGIYGLLQIARPLKSECVECDCPQCPNSENVSASDLNTAFLTLEPQGQNIIYSPLSIRYGLSLLNSGAASTTKSQIENVLGSEPLPRYENIPETLSLANAVFIKDSFAGQVRPSYVDIVQNDYASEIIYDDFASSQTMDDWVDQKTFGLIKQIGAQVDASTKMVLANALAIQMPWAHQFDSGSTHDRSFYKENDEEVQAEMMSGLAYAEDIKYYTGDNLTALSLPLQSTEAGTNLDFTAIMPHGKLQDYISSFGTSALDDIAQKSIPANTPEDGVQIYIPKFKFDHKLDFENDLKSLGVTQAFTEDADFSAMADIPLMVSGASHQANIEFSEDGIKAAAVTSFSIAGAAASQDPPDPVIIDINRPFLFVIRDRDNGAIWFTGAVYEPKVSD